MSISSIQGQLLELTVVCCRKLKNTEWISKQDPYVCLEYGGSKFRTRTCKDGGKNPNFQAKFSLHLIEGLLELNVVVWNKNTLTYDDFIGTGKILLHKVLSNGYDDNLWPLMDKRGRHAGEIQLVMFYSHANNPAKGHAYMPLAPSYAAATPAHKIPHYSTPPPVSFDLHKDIPEAVPYPFYPPNPSAYPLSPYHQPATHPPAYPPEPYPPSYAPLATYPPPPHNPHYYPPGSYPPAPYRPGHF